MTFSQYQCLKICLDVQLTIQNTSKYPRLHEQAAMPRITEKQIIMICGGVGIILVLPITYCWINLMIEIIFLSSVRLVHCLKLDWDWSFLYNGKGHVNAEHICSPIYLGKIKPLWKLYSSLVEREWSWFVYESLVMWYCYRWL
jgi:hypothetical protein